MMRSVIVIMTLFFVLSSTSASAIDWFGKSKTIGKKKAAKIYKEALSAYGSADYSKAIKLSGKAIEKDVKFAKAYLLRGKAMKDMGNVAEAQKDLNRAIQLDSKLGEAYYVRAITYDILGEMKKAKADYKKGCSLGFRAGC